MPFAYELTWTDPNFQHLKNTVTERERAYNDYREYVNRHEAELQDIQTWHHLLEDNLTQTLADAIETPQGRRFATTVRDALNVLVSTATAQHTSAKGYLGGIITDLTRAREQVRRYPPDFQGERRVSKAEITEALAGLPNLKPGSIATGYLSYNIPFVRWVFTEVFLRPDENPYAWLRGLGAENIPSIPLQDVQVTVSLVDGTVRLAPVRGQRDQAPFTWDHQNRVHPHILSHDEPCLGDFAGPFREALDEFDWVSVYTYLRLFLERAINRDAAGAKWVQPFITTLSMHNLACHADIAYPLGQPTHGCWIVETTPGCYELRVKDSHSLTEGELILSKPLELRDRYFQEAPMF